MILSLTPKGSLLYKGISAARKSYLNGLVVETLQFYENDEKGAVTMSL
jgi:hypothetical protein